MSTIVYKSKTKKNNKMLKYYANQVARFFDELYSNDPLVDIFDTNRKIKFCQKRCEEIRKDQEKLDRRYKRLK